MARLLFVDDDRTAATTLCALFRRRGHETRAAHGASEALAMLAETPAELVVTDLRMPGMDGLGLLRELHRRWPETAVIVATAFGSVEAAVEAMQLGAFDFVTKPLNMDELGLKVQRALGGQALERQVERLNARLASYEAERPGLGSILGQSPAMARVFDAIEKVAPTDATVLVLGESGTGKELVARAIHQRSKRADGPFVQTHAAAYAEGVLESELFGHERGAFTGAAARKLGRFELADGGTLFLDEVGDVPPSTQVKLLRALQERRFERVGGTSEVPVDIRVVAATNRDLGALIGAGTFREDLYYRLKVFTIEMPPLRARAGDLPLLATAFVETLGRGLGRPAAGFAPGVMDALAAYRWPGNVRELRNVLERAVILADGGLVELEHLPDGARPAAAAVVALPEGEVDFDAEMSRFERRLILHAYERAGGVKAQAARLLGIDRNRLRYKLEKLGIGD